MRVLIVEDETAAAKNLSTLLLSIEPSLEVLAVIDTVTDTVKWLSANPLPDLIFMDIHLADGRAFNIFEQIEVVSPIIFTTAYDQYALEAFKVNSIDYILKPIKTSELERALNKFKHLTHTEKENYIERTNVSLKTSAHTFLIPIRDRIIPLEADDISYFYTSNEKVVAVNLENKSFPIDKPLDQVITQINSTDFFRANRQFIVSRKAINDMSIWFGSRLSINLKVETPERIIVSKARVSEFKRWFMGI